MDAEVFLVMGDCLNVVELVQDCTKASITEGTEMIQACSKLVNSLDEAVILSKQVKNLRMVVDNIVHRLQGDQAQ